jgi:exodeoxyribonuclease VII large subunit
MFLPVWNVSDLNRYIRQILENDSELQQVLVMGEISNLSRPGSGHLYFDLKDASAGLRCIVWRSQVIRLGFTPRNGDLVYAQGQPTVYEANGQCQLNVQFLQLAGLGDLHRQFEAIKQKLAAQGLFDEARKRPLPTTIQRVAVVTSPTGAVIHDICTVLRRRWPLMSLWLAPTSVQGSAAPAEICDALALAAQAKPDVIILARGGGSLEDLAAFNNEAVALAIAASPVPLVSAVGHETDFTIADFVADVRAATPSAAAELVSPDRQIRAQTLHRLQASLLRAMQAYLQRRWQSLQQQQRELAHQSPQARLGLFHQKFAVLHQRLQQHQKQALITRRTQLEQQAALLEAFSPLKILERGYAIVTQPETGAVITNPAQAAGRLQVQVQGGTFAVEVVFVE